MWLHQNGFAAAVANIIKYLNLPRRNVRTSLRSEHSWGALKLGVTGLFKLGLGLSVAEVRNEWFFRDENFIYLLPSGVPILFKVVLEESSQDDI